jgi:hypothetical protein
VVTFNMLSIEKAREKILECNVLLKHMTFLQNNGFSDYGRGQIIGQIALLKEYLGESEVEAEQQNENNREAYRRNILDDKLLKDRKVEERQQTISTRNSILYEQAGEKIAETIFRKNSSNSHNNSKSSLLKGVENIIDKAKDIKILD